MDALATHKFAGVAFGVNLTLVAAHVAWILNGGEWPATLLELRRGTAVAMADVPADPPAPEPIAVFSAAVSEAAPTTPGAPDGAAAPSTCDLPDAAANGLSGFRVQVASFRKLESARREAARLSQHGLEASTSRVDLGSKGVWYRVYAGSYADHAAAIAARDSIRQLSDWVHAYVLHVPGIQRVEPLSSEVQRHASGESSGEATARRHPETLTAAPQLRAVEIEAQRYVDFGRAQAGRGRHADAVEAFQRAADIAPSAAEPRTLLAAEYLGLGRLVEAEEEILQAETRTPEDPRHLYNRALLAFKNNDVLEAQLALVRLFGVDWTHVPGRLLMGATFETTGDCERALVELRHAYRIAPSDPEVLYALARALDLNGRRQEALAIYEDFLARALGDGPWATVLDAVRRRVEWLQRT